MRKLFSSLRIATTLLLARTFGTYRCTFWNGEFEYAVYQWRGRKWIVPLTPMEKEEGCSD